MPEEKKKPAAEVKSAPSRAAAVEAWHSASTEEQRLAAIKQFPVLAELYSIAHELAKTIKS